MDLLVGRIKTPVFWRNMIFRFYSPFAHFLTAQDIEILVPPNIAHFEGKIWLPFFTADATNISKLLHNCVLYFIHYHYFWYY